MIKITYSSTKPLVAGIMYQTKDGTPTQLVNILYLDAYLGRPIYEYEEEGDEDKEGIFNRSFAKREKKYRITTKVLEHIIDTLSVIQLHDNIVVEASNGKSFAVSEFSVSDPEWDDGAPAIGEVTITFTICQDAVFMSC